MDRLFKVLVNYIEDLSIDIIEIPIIAQSTSSRGSIKIHKPCLFTGKAYRT